MDTKILIQEILNAMRQIVDPSFKYMMTLALQQVKVQIFYDAVWGFIFTVLTIICYLVLRNAKRWKKAYDENEGKYNTSYLDDCLDNYYAVVVTLSVIFGMLFFAVAVINYGSIVGKFLNPEWYAVKNIVSLIQVP